MRLVHLSDLHLGFRQFQRLTAAGINQREADVASAFRRAVDATIELRPELVVIAGDVFHAVRPPNPAILHAFTNVARLKRELPDAIVVMTAGNHDTPRASETGCILRLFRQIGVHVADTDAQRFQFPEKGLSILAVPSAVETLPVLRPEPEFARNVLVMHREIHGMVSRHAALDDRPSFAIDRKELNASQWSYVALGHYHVHRQVEPNAWFSGSLEYTSTNPWGELLEQEERGIPGKGFIEFDLESGECTFHPVPATRAFVDLPQLSARGLTSLELDERIAASVAACAGGIDDKIVRLIVRDVPRHIARELDHALIRGYKRRALHFLLDTRRPEVARIIGKSGAQGMRRSLEDTVRDKLNARVLESDIDRTALIELGIGYLREAEAADAARVEAEA